MKWRTRLKPEEERVLIYVEAEEQGVRDYGLGWVCSRECTGVGGQGGWEVASAVGGASLSDRWVAFDLGSV